MRLFFLILICLMSRELPALAEPATIFILRHAEKINDQDVHLSERGRQRAEALARYFTQAGFVDRFGAPAALFAVAAPEGQSRRSIETLIPSGQALGLPVNSETGKGDEKRLMGSILENPAYDSKTVIISWSHGNIPRFLKVFGPELGAPEKWPKGAYDRFWILEKTDDGIWTFRDLPQKLLPGDSEN